ncbi:hypothetical protein N7582_001761 [Saccharomyces uvarum]|nr:hypothetical protein N7582_001761 [Saccharomyces uvarum]
MPHEKTRLHSTTLHYTHNTSLVSGQHTSNCGNTMNVPSAPTPNKQLNIPDLRFGKVFERALYRDLTPSASRSRKLAVVAKVVVRDVLLMPLVQSIVLSVVLIGVKDWLRYIRLKGFTLGARLRQRLFPI